MVRVFFLSINKVKKLTSVTEKIQTEERNHENPERQYKIEIKQSQEWISN